MVASLFELLTRESWKTVLKDEFTKPYIKELNAFLATELCSGKSILPEQDDWLKSLNTISLHDVKVVILGQDPYPTAGHAHGLSFSVQSGVKPLPKSLSNIYKELQSDYGIDNTRTGYLLPWAEQGVLLLNAVLTVEEGKTNSHKGRGWEQFTDRVIESVNDHCQGVVFVLWGAHAQKKDIMIDKIKHHVISSPHPSPLSAYRGFWGSKPFSRINEYLAQNGKKRINWKL